MPSRRRARPLQRVLAAGAASVLVPGLGHVIAGLRRRGLWWLAGTAAMLLVAVAPLAGAEGPLAARLLDPRLLLWLLAANVAVGLVRAAAVVDATRAVRPTVARSRARLAASTLAGALLLAVTLAPHVLAATYGWQTHRVLTNVFVAGAEQGEPERLQPSGTEPGSAHPSQRPSPGTSDPDEAPTAGSGRTPGTASDSVSPTHPTTSDGSGGTPEPDPTRVDPGVYADRDVPTPSAAPSVAGEDGRLTVALLGSDAGPGRHGARTDAMLVVSLDVATGDAAVFSAPRNLTGFPTPDRVAAIRARCPDSGGWRHLSAVYTCLAEHPEEAAAAFPGSGDPAAAGTAATLAELTGLEVDHHAMVDLGGFVHVVDALGGVDAHLDRPLRTRLSPAEEGGDWISVDLPAGTQRLSGPEALAFVRSRTGTDDYDRMRRQRCLVGSLAATTDAATLVRSFPALAGVLVDHVRTDIPVEHLPELLGLRDVLDLDRLVTVGFTPPRYQRPDGTPDLEAVRAVVARALADPGALLEEGGGAKDLTGVCG